MQAVPVVTVSIECVESTTREYGYREVTRPVFSCYEAAYSSFVGLCVHMIHIHSITLCKGLAVHEYILLFFKYSARVIFD